MAVQESVTVTGSAAGSAAGLAQHVENNRVPEEQLRFAVVLNGGVSLAVWMGGVVLELNRLTKSRPGRTGPYALMQLLTSCGSRVDVISGTSAGGINGAALALSQVRTYGDPSPLRDLWTEQGRIESLLRRPFRGQPTSLLQGDEYFLPQLNSAMEILGRAEGTTNAKDAPIDLTITTTVLRGNQSVSVDSMGQQLPQRLHAGRFRWRRDEGKDPFADAHIRRTAHRLALAARASASFPFAFEPAFIPVGSPAHRDPEEGEPLTDELRLRPDMRDHVEDWGGGETRNRSRFVIDGGALANTPTLSALEAIERMPASGPVRRVMLLVFPHAPEVGPDPEDSAAEPPTVAGAMSGFLGALTAQGSRTYVDALDRHNLAAAGRRTTRSDILEGLKNPEALEGLAGNLYPEYARMRRRRAARDLAAWRTGMTRDKELAVRDLPDQWNFERVRAAAEAAQQSYDGLPYVPAELPTVASAQHTDDQGEQHIDGWGVEGPRGWGWGVSGALGIAEATSDLLRRMVWVMTEEDVGFAEVKAGREAVLLLAEDLRKTRDLTDKHWREKPELTRLPPDQSYWTLRLRCYDHLMLGRVKPSRIRTGVAAYVRIHPELGQGKKGEARVEEILEALKTDVLTPPPASAGETVRAYVGTTLTHLRTGLLVLGLNLERLQTREPSLAHWYRGLAPKGFVPDEEELLVRLMHLEITSTLLGDEVTTGASLPVSLVQISAQTPVPFAHHTRTADDKLGGMAVARFGGFLKRSWRVNDWIWGRVDGATSLARTVLDPQRIRRTARLSGYVTEEMSGEECLALAGATVDDVIADLGDLAPHVSKVKRDRMAQELRPVFDLRNCEPGDLPSALPLLSDLFATALHHEVVAEELPSLARAIRADRVDGANPRSRGEVFLAEHEGLLARLDAGAAASEVVTPADRRTALEVFDRAGIGREALHEEASSDLIIRTGSTAAAVISTVVDSDRSGLAALKPVTRTLRGAMLLPYWAITGLTSRQPLARSLALLALALGGVLLALSLFDALPEGLAGPAAALGAGAVLAAFAYAALRTGSLLHGVVLLTPVIPLVTYAVTRGERRGGLIVMAVVALALGLMLLGSMGFATRSVWAALDGLADACRLPAGRSAPARMLRRLGAVALVVGVGFALGAVALFLVRTAAPWAFSPDRIDDASDGLSWFGDNVAGPAWLWGLLLVLALVVAASVVAHFSGRRLQVLAPGRAGGDYLYSPLAHADAVAAGWSVLYGTVYLLVAWVLTLGVLDLGNSWWSGVGFALAVLFSAALLFVVPLWLPWRGLRGARSEQLARVRGEKAVDGLGVGQPARRAALTGLLVERRVSYRCFVRPGSPGTAELTKGGEKLEQRLQDCRAAVSLRARTSESWLRDDRERYQAALVTWLNTGPGKEISRAAARRAGVLQAALADSSVGDAQLLVLHRQLLAALDPGYRLAA